MDTSTLTIIFTRRDDLEAQLTHLKRGTAFVPVPDPEPQPLSTPTVVFVAGSESVSFASRVLQVVAGAGVALECADPSVGTWVHQTAAGLPATGDDARAQWGGATASNEEPAEEEDNASVRDRIRALSMNEKYQLALHGTKLERTILLRDPNKNIQAHIIKNRRITLDEVRYIAGFRQANPDVLKQIGEKNEWVQNPRIASALVGNPKTPPILAKKLLAKLPITEVRRLAKSPNTPRAVAAAAKKMVNSSQR